MVRSHENAIDGAGIDTQCTEHAFGVVDDKAIDSKPFANRALFFFDINAVYWTGGSAFVAANARCEIKPMEATIPRLDSKSRFGIRVSIGKRFSLGAVRFDHLFQGD